MSRPPNGLVFSAAGAPRRRRWIFAAVVAAALLALVWPVYPRFGGLYPFVFGLPLSFAWVVLWLFVVFGALVWLYHTDHRR